MKIADGEQKRADGVDVFVRNQFRFVLVGRAYIDVLHAEKELRHVRDEKVDVVLLGRKHERRVFGKAEFAQDRGVRAIPNLGEARKFIQPLSLYLSTIRL